MNLLTEKSKKIFAVLAAALSPVMVMAQDAAHEVSKTWFMHDFVFWLLTIVAIVLLYVIYALSELLIMHVKRKTQEKNTTAMMLLAMISFALVSGNAQAQATGATTSPASSIFADPYFPLYILIAIEVIIIGYMAFLLYSMSKAEEPMPEYVPQQSMLSKIWQKLNPVVPIEKENDILLDDHEYDGIRELDNGMPPWLQFIFFATVLFAVIYIPYYFLGYGPTQQERYDESVAKAELVKAERMKSNLDFVDENTVTLMQTADVLAAGKETFVTYCVACHGNAGEGGVGPNLTDDYWLHGGAINNLFTTIKYGVPEKGMAAWNEIITPKQISEVANYIKSLYNTNPPNAKEPQGELWQESAAPADSTNNTADSTSVAMMQY